MHPIPENECRAILSVIDHVSNIKEKKQILMSIMEETNINEHYHR